MTHPKQASAGRFGVALLRVSTDKQMQEGQSIDAQRRKVDFMAKRQQVDVVRYFVEHYTGSVSDRRILNELFAFLKDNPDITVVYVGDIDRLTRGGTEVYLALKRQLYEIGVDLVDTTGIIQPSRNRLEHLGVEYAWAVESPSHYAEIFMAEKARAERSDILVRTVGSQVQLTREGYQVRPAPYGYRNVKISTADGKKKTVMEPHPDEAVFLRRIFQLRAEGKTTDEQIAQHINAMGYQSRTRRIFDQNTRKVVGQTRHKPMTPQQIQRLVKKPIYCGVRLEAWNNGEAVEAQIEPLISVHLFNAANRGAVAVTKDAQGQPRVKTNLNHYKNHRHNADFLLRHVVRCPKCEKPMLASKSRGKSGQYFGYYHCNRGHAYFGVSKAEFETTVAKYLDSLQAKPGFLDLFREVVRDVWIQKNRAIHEQDKAVNDQIDLLETKQTEILEMLPACKSPIVRERLEAQVEELEASIEDARAEKIGAGVKESEIDRFFAIAKNMLEHPKRPIFDAVAKPEIEKHWSHIFEVPPTYAEIQNGTPRLALLYRLNRDFVGDKKPVVAHLSEHWNTFTAAVQQALELS